jgi:hypothetical protein
LQIKLYARVVGATRVLYDVVKKPQIRVKAAKGETIEEYQGRVDSLIKENPHEFYQHRLLEVEWTHSDEQELYQLSEEIHRCQKNGVWPKNSGACDSYFGVCPYLPVCSGTMSLEDNTFFRDHISPSFESLGGKSSSVGILNM